MGYADDWKKAKTKFETETKQQKPDKKMALVIKVHTGLAGACKALDAAIDGEAPAAAEVAMKELSKAIAGYAPSAKSAAAKSGPVYKAAIAKLLKSLTKIETNARRAVDVLAATTQDRNGSAYNVKFGSIPSDSAGFGKAIQGFLTAAGKANLPVKDLKGAPNYVNGLLKFEKTVAKLRASRPAVLKSMASGDAKSEQLMAAYEAIQAKAIALQAPLLKSGRGYDKVLDDWFRDVKKDGTVKPVEDLVRAMGSCFADAHRLVSDGGPEDELEPLPKEGARFNAKFGSLPAPTDFSEKAWSTFRDCAESAGLPVRELKGAPAFGTLITRWAAIRKKAASTYELLLAAQPEDHEQVAAMHAKVSGPLEGMVGAMSQRVTEYGSVANKWSKLTRGLPVDKIVVFMGRWLGIASSHLGASLEDAGLSTRAKKALAKAAADADARANYQ